MNTTWPNFSPSFYRLLIAGIIVFVGLYFGINFQTIPSAPKVGVRNVSANISLAIRDGMKVRIEEEVIDLNGEEIKNWTENYIRSYSGEKDTRINIYKVREYINAFASRINIEPVNARFEMTEGKVSVFQASVTGRRLNIEESAVELIGQIRSGRDNAVLVIDSVEPELTLEKVNRLGINTLLGQGESNFTGSSPARIHNIRVGMARFNGLLIKPGEQFSFNSLLGEVDDKTGYQPELVIRGGKLVREYGGGICQVSTTLFRSVIYTGLPIIERRPHSFPVRYYNPQGFDSTIYPGVTDLKFVNDTPNHILIQNKINGTKLTFEIYGSADGRKVSIDGPHQYDQKRNGSMRAYFTRKIETDGEIKEQRFDSVYKAPPASPLERNPLE